jgi:hypothetical protein
MGQVSIGATLSLDGFMRNRHGDIGRLYPDLEVLRHNGRRRDGPAYL